MIVCSTVYSSSAEHTSRPDGHAQLLSTYHLCNATAGRTHALLHDQWSNRGTGPIYLAGRYGRTGNEFTTGELIEVFTGFHTEVHSG